jgi:hypothetical protein
MLLFNLPNRVLLRLTPGVSKPYNLVYNNLPHGEELSLVAQALP